MCRIKWRSQTSNKERLYFTDAEKKIIGVGEEDERNQKYLINSSQDERGQEMILFHIAQ